MKIHGFLLLSAIFLSTATGQSVTSADGFDRSSTGRTLYHQIPTTSFRCEDQQWAGYYSDPEAQCQVFHICVRRHGTLEQFSFLCPNETVFHQELLVCVWWDSFDCQTATLNYNINENIFEEEESSVRKGGSNLNGSLKAPRGKSASVVEPKIPLRTEPQTPLRTEPQTPLRTEPQTPLRTEPQTPLRTEPQTPLRTEPQTPFGTELPIQLGSKSELQSQSSLATSKKLSQPLLIVTDSSRQESNLDDVKQIPSKPILKTTSKVEPQAQISRKPKLQSSPILKIIPHAPPANLTPPPPPSRSQVVEGRALPQSDQVDVSSQFTSTTLIPGAPTTAALVTANVDFINNGRFIVRDDNSQSSFRESAVDSTITSGLARSGKTLEVANEEIKTRNAAGRKVESQVTLTTKQPFSSNKLQQIPFQSKQQAITTTIRPLHITKPATFTSTRRTQTFVTSSGVTFTTRRNKTTFDSQTTKTTKSSISQSRRTQANTSTGRNTVSTSQSTHRPTSTTQQSESFRTTVLPRSSTQQRELLQTTIRPRSSTLEREPLKTTERPISSTQHGEPLQTTVRPKSSTQQREPIPTTIRPKSATQQRELVQSTVKPKSTIQQREQSRPKSTPQQLEPSSSKFQVSPSSINSRQTSLDILHDLLKNITIIKSSELLSVKTNKAQRFNVKRKVDNASAPISTLKLGSQNHNGKSDFETSATFTSSRGINRTKAPLHLHDNKKNIIKNKSNSKSQNPGVVHNNRIKTSATPDNGESDSVLSCIYYYGSKKRPNCNLVSQRAQELQNLGLTDLLNTRSRLNQIDAQQNLKEYSVNEESQNEVTGNRRSYSVSGDDNEIFEDENSPKELEPPTELNQILNIPSLDFSLPSSGAFVFPNVSLSDDELTSHFLPPFTSLTKTSGQPLILVVSSAEAETNEGNQRKVFINTLKSSDKSNGFSRDTLEESPASPTYLPTSNSPDLSTPRTYLPTSSSKNDSPKTYLPTSSSKNVSPKTYLPFSSSDKNSPKNYLPTSSSKNASPNTYLPTSNSKNSSPKSYLPASSPQYTSNSKDSSPKTYLPTTGSQSSNNKSYLPSSNYKSSTKSYLPASSPQYTSSSNSYLPSPSSSSISNTPLLTSSSQVIQAPKNYLPNLSSQPSSHFTAELTDELGLSLPTENRDKRESITLTSHEHPTTLLFILRKEVNKDTI